MRKAYILLREQKYFATCWMEGSSVDRKVDFSFIVSMVGSRSRILRGCLILIQEAIPLTMVIG